LSWGNISDIGTGKPGADLRHYEALRPLVLSGDVAISVTQAYRRFSPMNRTFLLAALSLGLVASVTPTGRGASITYAFRSYDSLQNGYTLTGTMTTDGKIGTLTSANITAWAYTITNGTTTDHESGGSNLVAVIGVTASANSISMAVPAYSFAGAPNNLIFSNSSVGLLIYNRTAAVNLPGFGDEYEAFSPSTGMLWQHIVSDPPGLSLGGNPWVIAVNLGQAVPEPGSLTLALLGLPCLAAAALWTRRHNRAATRPLLGPKAHS
jgi:hypothetical protein